MTSAPTIASGGVEYDHGSASGATVLSGGQEIVFSGGTASATTINGGYVDIQSGGGIGGSTITFAGGGLLQLDNSVSFAGPISGFGGTDLIDLRDIAIGAGPTVSFTEAPSNLSGTLSVSGGGQSAGITLIGQYVSGQFHLVNDGLGGTLVTDPPVPAGGAGTGFDFTDVGLPNATIGGGAGLPLANPAPSGDTAVFLEPPPPSLGFNHASGMNS